MRQVDPNSVGAMAPNVNAADFTAAPVQPAAPAQPAADPFASAANAPQDGANDLPF